MQELAAATKIGYYELKMLYHILIKFAAAANLFFFSIMHVEFGLLELHVGSIPRSFFRE